MFQKIKNLFKKKEKAPRVYTEDDLYKRLAFPGVLDGLEDAQCEHGIDLYWEINQVLDMELAARLKDAGHE